MDKPITHFWRLRLEALQKNLEKNNFEAHVVENAQKARELALQKILPSIDIKSVSWGGSMTFLATELYGALKENTALEIIDTYDKSLSPAEMIERRRESLLADLFITGTNAITEKGHLINLDMIGNRVAAITFGPKHVLLFIGRNKLAADVTAAMDRVKRLAAPPNAMRLDKQTPCAMTGYCQNCNTPDRICNSWTITEKCYPKGRIKVVLINDDLGL